MVLAGVDNSICSPGIVILTLDDNLEVVKYDYLNFNKTKKLHIENHIYPLPPYKNQCERIIEKNEFIVDELVKRKVEIVAIEEYSFGSNGLAFDLGENTGFLKILLYKKNIRQRYYEPTTNKMAFTSKGTASKTQMVETYIHDHKNPLDLPDKILDILETLKENSKKSLSPLEDIVDAFALAELLRLELRLRKGLVEMKSLPESKIRVFNKIHKSHNTNILDTDFV
jgi:Holliday junction resolvasome RuvABC endonuclease subunit